MSSILHNIKSVLQLSSLVLCSFPNCQSRVSKLPLAQVSYFCGFPHHGLNPFAHIIAAPSFQLDSESSAQCLAVNL